MLQNGIDARIASTLLAMDPAQKTITLLLDEWNAGDPRAGQEIMELVYQELRRLAAYHLGRERPDHTLQPTALVNELYLKLFSKQPLACNDRGHFLAIVSRQIRRILVDYARTQGARKRGGDHAHVPLEQAAGSWITVDTAVIDLDEALQRLAELDTRAAQVVELRYFGGLTENEVAEALHISRATVKRDWEFARTWLLKEIT